MSTLAQSPLRKPIQSHPASAPAAAWHRIYDLIFRFTRGRRMAHFEEHMKLTGKEVILDVGGDTTNWHLTQTSPKVVLFNLNIPSDAVDDDRFAWIQGDATALPYGDGEFELVFSNSVIEHLGNFASQKKFAAECRRTGGRLWIQTPALGFPIEPHYLTPFVHWLPKWMRRRLLRWCSFWGWMTRPSQQKVDEQVAEIRLLSKREMRELFPDCEILVERFCFWPKSYIAVRDEAPGARD
jgi:SAM-dependent methyltransferase